MSGILAVSLGVIAVLLVILVGILIAWFDDRPVTPPALPDEEEADPERLFSPRRWVKSSWNGETSPRRQVPNYNRPQDIELVPDDRVLPPPRRVRGVNGQE